MTSTPAPHAVQSDLRLLAPRFGLALADALNALHRRGIDAVVYETLRTPARQAWLYAQGRTAPGDVVTNAATVWTSWHGYALAADVISASQGWGAPAEWWQAMTREMKARGLVCGADWQMRDLPHVQWGRPMRTSPSPRAHELYVAGGLAAVWAEVRAA